MNNRIIPLVFLALLGIPLLLVLGQWTATDPLLAGAATLALLLVIVVITMGRNLWLLIILAYPFAGAMGIVPGNFSPRHLVVGFVLPILIAHWVMKRFPVRFRFGMIEFMLLMQFVLLGQAFLRNPAGLAILGSESVGARPYFEMGVGLVAFFILSVQVVNLRSVKQAMACHFLGSILLACLEMVSRVVPQVAARLSPFYRTAMATSAMVSIERSAMHGRSLDSGTGRLMYLRWFTEPLGALLFAWRRPVDVLNPLKIVAVSIFLICIVCALLSGFRSQVAWIGLMFLAAGFARRRLFDIVIAAGIGIPALAVMLVLQGSVVDLPMPAQRALSFLPADWDHQAVGSARGSTEWRLEMWKLALTTDRHIENKWLGDGFGFSAQELAYQAQLESAGLRPEELKEYYMTTGGFHSGPVETIRRVGYVGLLVLLVGFVVFSREAVRLIRLCLGTPYQMPALYFGLPLIVLPVMFVFVIGSYASAVGQLCVIGGLLRLIRNSYEAQTQEDYDAVPESSNATVHGKPLAATN